MANRATQINDGHDREMMGRSHRHRRLGLGAVAAWIACAVLAVAATPATAAPGLEIVNFTTEASTTAAGGHPDVSASIDVDYSDLTAFSFPRDMALDLPAGLMGNPNVVAQCPRSAFSRGGSAMLQQCPAESQVGFADLVLNSPDGDPQRGAVFVMEAGPNQPAALAIAWSSIPSVLVAVEPRTESDFGVTTISRGINSQLAFFGLDITIWGVPGAHERGGFACGFLCTSPTAPPDPVDERKAFMTNPTVCDAPKETRLEIRTYGDPDTPVVATSEDPTPTGCGEVPFEPDLSLTPSSAWADGASGLTANLSLPQSDDPDEIGTSHLRKVEVTLPEGVSLNPSVADGVVACTDAQFGDGSRAPATCPPASKIGDVEFESPVLPEPLQGAIYLGQPLSTDPQSDTMFRVFQYAEGRGMTIKIPGYAKADPLTGRITATFDELPQVPLSAATLTFKGGPRGVLALPEECGVRPWSASFTPWSGGPEVERGGTFAITEGCGAGFSPTLAAGMSSTRARGGGTFSFVVERPEGQRWLSVLTAALPDGLLARVAGVPLCREPQAAAGECPAASKIGTVDAEAGSGKPFHLERPGELFLTEGYKGGEYGLLARIPVEAGPFRGAVALSPIVVRQAVHVDRATARVRAVSDPLPIVHHGIPLRVRRIVVSIDRGDFMVNPSGCSAKQVGAALTAVDGSTADVGAGFRATGCAALPFKPRIAMRLTGPKQTTTGRHPGVRAVVRQAGVGEAGIRRAVVRLPRTLALDPDNAQALCEFADGTAPNLEDRCPRASIVGRARAVSPLLERDLVGNVYFVKNVRVDPKTGNEIRTLPMLIVALRGEIAINLRGVSSTTKGGLLVNTFEGVPDAPISRFNLNVKGGKSGVLAVTGSRRGRLDICSGRQLAVANLDGHNGRRHDFRIGIQTPCRKRRAR